MGLGLLVCLLSLLFFLVRPVAAAGPPAEIVDGLVMNSERELLLYFRLGDAMTPAMKEGVNNGITLAIIYQVELLHHASTGLESLANITFSRTLLFDTLKEEYRVTSTRQGEGAEVAATLAAAQRHLTWVHDLPLIALSGLAAGDRYLVKVMARLDRKGLPVRFQNVIGFVKTWDFTTDWYHITFAVPQVSP